MKKRWQVDDWKKPRGHGEHLTSDEKEFIAEGFRKGRTARDVARDLKCASRTVQIYYRAMKGDTSPKRARIKVIERPKAPPPDRAKRFYRSNFEI